MAPVRDERMAHVSWYGEAVMNVPLAVSQPWRIAREGEGSEAGLPRALEHVAQQRPVLPQVELQQLWLLR